jgi:DNA-binding protein HU-beta
MAKISKTKLIEEIAKQGGVTKKEVNYVIDELLKKIVENVKNDNEVTIVGFGTFKPKINKARNGINPKTKEQIKILASRTIGFKASDKLKETL